jgi:hypothetical protein
MINNSCIIHGRGDVQRNTEGRGSGQKERSVGLIHGRRWDGWQVYTGRTGKRFVWLFLLYLVCLAAQVT